MKVNEIHIPETVPTTWPILLEEHGDILVETKGLIRLVKKDNSRNFYLFINGTLIQEMRPPRVMSFLDGWKLAQAFNSLIPQQKEDKQPA